MNRKASMRWSIVTAIAMAGTSAVLAAGIPLRPLAGPAEKQAAQERAAALNRHPFRIVSGMTNHISGPGWVHFYGKVLQVSRDGVRMEGGYGRLGDSSPREVEFFIRNFPFVVADEQYLGTAHYLMAKESGTFTYTTVLGGTRTLRALDYGVPCRPPLARPVASTNTVSKPSK